LTNILSRVPGRDVYQRSQFVPNCYISEEGLISRHFIFSKRLQLTGMSVRHEVEIKLFY